MKEFTDVEGQKWEISVNVAAVKRVRDLCKIDLLEASSADFWDKIANDIVQLVDIIYVVCKPQADKLQITDEEFGRRMAGDTIRFAYDAFLEELINFFPNPRVRGSLKTLLEVGQKIQDRAQNQLDEKLANPDQIADELFGQLFGKSLASSA